MVQDLFVYSSKKKVVSHKIEKVLNTQSVFDNNKIVRTEEIEKTIFWPCCCKVKFNNILY